MFLPVAIPDPPRPAPHDSPEVVEWKRQHHWAYRQIQVLEERLGRQCIQKYGPQLELLELEPGVSNLEVQAESGREPLPAGAERTARAPSR